MDLATNWPLWLTWLLAAGMVVNGLINIVGPQGMRDGFARWGFPPYWHIVNGIICLAIGVMLAWAPLRPVGFALGFAECIAIYVTLIRKGEAAHLPPAIVLGILLAVACWGMYGAG